MKRKNIYIILLLSMFALTSCKVGKSYVRPEMALPDSLAQQQDSMSIADEQWQAVYTDSTLRALIDRALEYNKDMLIAASRVKEMAAQKRISVANLLPQLTGKVEAEREVENYGGHSRDVGNTYEAKALLSWELDLWGNLRWKKVAAVAEYLQSVEAQRALRMTIVAGGIPYPYQACQFSAGTGCAGVLTGRSAFRFVGTSPRCPCGGAAVEG